MGLFEKAGRRFEQFKKRAETAAEEEAEFACTACETRLYAAAEACPECDTEGSVVPLDGDEETADGASDSAEETDSTPDPAAGDEDA